MRLAILLCATTMISSCISNQEGFDLVFVGDSITHAWDLNHSFPQYISHKHAVVGATLWDVSQWDLSESKGKETILLIGTNSCTLDSATFLRQYQQVLDNLKEAAPLIIISVLPRNHNSTDPPGINAHIYKLNTAIRELARHRNAPTRFIDVYSSFLNPDGSLHGSYFYDGLHPGQAGYELLASKVRPVL